LLIVIGSKQNTPINNPISDKIFNLVKQKNTIKIIIKGKEIKISDISIPLNPKFLFIDFNVIYIFPPT